MGRDTRQRPAVEADTTHCPVHDDMLTKADFWRVVVLVAGIGAAAAGLFFANSASAESVGNLATDFRDLKGELAQEREERKDLAEQWREDFRLLRNDIKTELRDLKTAKRP